MGSFALRSVHQSASFELWNTAFGQFLKIFTITGDPSDFGGVKISGKEKTGSKIKKKNCFEISITKPTQKWVVDVWWTILGCMHWYGRPVCPYWLIACFYTLQQQGIATSPVWTTYRIPLNLLRCTDHRTNPLIFLLLSSLWLSL